MVKQRNRYDDFYVVVSSNGIKWLFPIDDSSFMTVMDLVNIERGIVPERWKRKR